MDLKYVIYRWLNTPEIRNHMILLPQNLTNSSGERVFGDFTSTIWYENCHLSAPLYKQQKPLMIIVVFEVDKTPISKSGMFCNFVTDRNSISLSIRVTCGNLPLSMQGNLFVRETIGYIPVLSNSEIDVSVHGSLCRCKLYHNCWSALLDDYKESLKGRYHTGNNVIYKLNTGMKIPTLFGEEWVFVNFLPPRGDLLDQLQINCHYAANFAALQSSCFTCTVAGAKLGEFTSNFDFVTSISKVIA